ncbi:transcription factor Adf-1-like [Spodoptera frugiperda]|uniref:Transcription factor Adf-1-like n=1 Tax=Spodoptera frugiperda TaxID=7108 RepID=A0A9R0F791_SPOFR|nr:transcription factor Adf-1-like [Spodoptera frugiperda]
MSDNKTVQLVKAIEKFPCLYNYNMPEYLKKDFSDRAWQEVASQTQLAVGECKEKWKNLRYGLLRSLKLNPDGSEKKKYYLHDDMEFVLPFIRTYRADPVVFQQIDAETDEEMNGYNDQDNESAPLQIQYQEIEVPEPPKKRSKTNDNFIKYLQQKQSNNSNNNEVSDDSRKMFLLSLLPEVNALTECQMRMFRRKIFTLLDEIVDSPSQYENCLFQWQKESMNQESHKSSDTIKQEPL